MTRSSRDILAQVIDDSRGVTLAAASTMEADLREASGDKTEKAKLVGTLLADRAKKAGVESVAFDRAGNKVPRTDCCAADGAREAGPRILDDPGEVK